MLLASHIRLNSILTWKGVVLQNDLVNDTGSWFPKSHSIFGSGGCQEVIDFAVNVLGTGKIFGALDLRLKDFLRFATDSDISEAEHKPE